MPTMVLSRAAKLQARRIRLPPGPAAVAEARGQVRAAIYAWDVPVDVDVAVLLTSELVTNAVKHAAGEAVTLGVRCTRDRLRVDVHDRSAAPPVLADVPACAEAGRGLAVVVGLSADWGFYRTPMGKVVYFALALSARAVAPDGEATSRRPRGRRPGFVAQLVSEGSGRDAANPSGPCKRCGGLGDAHYLTCPLLQLPTGPESAP
jgi:anti-sigma regulatory factor (Ser/Thr protein kinase)